MALPENYNAKQKEKDTRINPEHLKKSREEPALVEGDQRLGFIDWIFNEIEQTTEKAKKHAESNKADCRAAL